MIKIIIGLIILSSIIGFVPTVSAEAALFFQKDILFEDIDGHLNGWNPGKIGNNAAPKKFVIKEDLVQQFSSVVTVNVQDDKPNVCAVDFIFSDGRFDVTCLNPPSNNAVLSYIILEDSKIEDSKLKEEIKPEIEL